MPAAIVYIDGQNLFHRAKEAFGYRKPNFDSLKLSLLLCRRLGHDLKAVHFYTGVPEPAHNPYWHAYWANKVRAMARAGIQVTTRPLRMHGRGRETTSHEKGIDVRIALDMVREAHAGQADALILVSQDQDFVEVAQEVRRIARDAGRHLTVASAFPDPGGRCHGVYHTDWLPLSRNDYANCLDPRDYTPTARQLKNLVAELDAPAPIPAIAIGRRRSPTVR